MCAGDQDCFAGRVCRLTRCTDPIRNCMGDADCPPGERCNDNVCEFSLGCQGDDECLQGFLCVNQQCVVRQQCANDNECTPGFACDANRCVASQCARLTAQQNNVAAQGTLTVNRSEFTLECNPANAPGAADKAFKFTLAAAADVDFDIGGIAGFVYVLDECRVSPAPAVLACGSTAAFAPTRLDAGTYTVVVEGDNGATGDFTITLRVR